MDKLRWALVIAALAVGTAQDLRGQELPKASKFPDADWYQVTYYRFKPGKVAEARSILYDHLIPTDKVAGRDVLNFDYRVGEWHHIAFFPLPEGAQDLTWQLNPVGERWNEELAKKLGGPREATELLSRWNDLIDETKTEVVMRRKP
jgi:hypothetical protein